MKNNPYVPKYIFLTKGVGTHKEKLRSFEQALRDAKIAPYNIVKVSSIFPPHCKKITRDEGNKKLDPGQIVHLVISESSSNEPNRLISASIGMANPQGDHYGYLSEHHDFGKTDEDCGLYSEKLAIGMFCSTVGIEFDIDKWIPEKYAKMVQIGDYKIRTRNITQSTTVGKEGLWTTVLAAAVFVPYYPNYEKMILEAIEPYIKRLEAVEKTSNRHSGIIGYLSGGFHKLIKILEISADRNKKDLEDLLKEDIDLKNNKS